MLFEISIILLVIAGFLGDSFSIREYKLPKLETGAKISLLFVASLLFLVNQKFYKIVNFEISNQVLSKSISKIVISSIKIADGIGYEKDLVIPSTLNNLTEKAKFKVPEQGSYYYLIEFTIYDSQNQLIGGNSEGKIDIQSGDIFDIEIDFKSGEPELLLFERLD